MTVAGVPPVVGSSRPPLRRALRKWGPWLALILVAVLVLGIGLRGGGGGAGKPTLDAEVQHIAAQVRCPVCDGQTAAQSQSAPSVAIRDQIRSELQAGQTGSQILAGLVRSYGTWILEKPPANGVGAVVWILPVVASVVGLAVLLLLLRHWRGRTDPAPADASGGDGLGGPLPSAPTSAAPVPLSRDRSAAAPGGPRGLRRSWGKQTSMVKVITGCAGLALVAGGASWAVVASSGSRLPGEAISGASLAPEQEAADLQDANTNETAGRILPAIQDYQKVLNADPTQVEALTGQGWLLSGTGEPSLLQQGLDKLAEAERVQPSYAPAHLYRGLALLGESNYLGAVPELQWYLSHQPDQQLASQVRKALSEAEAGAAAESRASSTTSKP